METKVHDFTIKTDTALSLKPINSQRFSSRGEVPLQLLDDRVLDLDDSPGKLSRITRVTTVGDRYNQPF